MCKFKKNIVDLDTDNLSEIRVPSGFFVLEIIEIIPKITDS